MRTATVCASMIEVSRTTIIVLVALGATLAGLALASSASRLRGSEEAPDTSVAAGPQSADLAWRETYGPPGEQVVFTVDSLEVTPSGWRARVGLKNSSSVAWELAPGATPDGTFGLQLFTTGDLDELEERNNAGTLPSVRAATSYEPDLPPILDPDASWEGEISANGALVAESWARVVFGTLVAVGRPPDELGDTVVWITDAAYRLRR
jgi:hypothetical protein